MKFPFNSPNRSKVRERGHSLTKELNNFIFSVFEYGVTLTPRTLAQNVSTYLETNHHAQAFTHSYRFSFLGRTAREFWATASSQ